MEKKNVSWGWIVFWLIIFWPVGLILVIKKFATDKSALISGKTIGLSVIGWLLIVWSTLMFIVFISDPASFAPAGAFLMIMVFIPLAGGIALLRKASNIKKKSVRYKKYIDIIVNQNAKSIDNISSAVGVSYDVATKDLQDMINIGYLKDAYIHQGNREIILKQNESAEYAQPMITGQTVSQTTAIRCQGCGANNVIIVGRVAECEYCGTPINA